MYDLYTYSKNDRETRVVYRRFTLALAVLVSEMPTQVCVLLRRALGSRLFCIRSNSPK